MSPFVSDQCLSKMLSPSFFRLRFPWCKAMLDGPQRSLPLGRHEFLSQQVLWDIKGGLEPFVWVMPLKVSIFKRRWLFVLPWFLHLSDWMVPCAENPNLFHPWSVPLIGSSVNRRNAVYSEMNENSTMSHLFGYMIYVWSCVWHRFTMFFPKDLKTVPFTIIGNTWVSDKIMAWPK